jgi:chorismate synthase
MPAGLTLGPESINRELARRQRGYGSGPRMKIEHDSVQLLGGVMGGETTGAPIAMLIPNLDHAKWKGKAIPPMTAPRPGHADLTGALKFGYRDLRPGLERASARETAARVAVGAVCKELLGQFGIIVGGYVRAIGEVRASIDGIPLEGRLALAEENELRCPDPLALDSMRARIEEIIRQRDTLGGVLEVAALGVPPGLGSFAQWDRRLEARLALAVMSVQAIKGVEVGEAFATTRLPGTQAQDHILLPATSRGGAPGAPSDLLGRPTNRAGGIEGGVSNGQPILIRAAMKPIATTLTPQRTVDLASGEEGPTGYERSDFCPVPRAVPILEAMIALVLADALIEKLGGDSLSEMRPRFDALRRARLEDLQMDNLERVWWA